MKQPSKSIQGQTYEQILHQFLRQFIHRYAENINLPNFVKDMQLHKNIPIQFPLLFLEIFICTKVAKNLSGPIIPRQICGKIHSCTHSPIKLYQICNRNTFYIFDC